MHVNRGLLGWGVFFIVLGAVPIAVNAGALDADAVRRAWQLWPLVLVGIGLGLLLQRTPAAVIGNLVVAVTLGLMGGALLATGLSGTFSGCGVGIGGGAGTPFETRTGTFGGDATAGIELNCGEVTVSPGPGSAWSVAGSDGDGTGPEITSSANRLRVGSPERVNVGVGQSGQRWTIVLPTEPAVRLDMSVNAGSGEARLDGMRVPTTNATVNAGDLELDLSGTLDVAELNASVNAGSMRITLPASSMTGNLSVNAGSIEVCVPAGAGVRVQWSSNPLSSNNFGEAGLVQAGSLWSTPGYASADVKIDLSASGTASSVSLNPENDCD